MNAILHWTRNTSTLTLLFSSIVLFVLSQATMLWLNLLYEATGFPVSFMEGQLAFDANKIKLWYAFLAQENTLNAYFWVQIYDYVYMLTVFVSHLVFMLFLYKCFEQLNVKLGFMVARRMIYIGPSAAVFDALENAVSFIMLASPQSFPDWLAFPYSSLALIKFILFTMTWCWMITGVIWVMSGKLRILLRKE